MGLKGDIMDIVDLVVVVIKLIDDILGVEELDNLECIDRNKIYMIKSLVELIGVRLESENIRI